MAAEPRRLVAVPAGLAIEDAVPLLLREWGLMLLVFLVIFGLGAVVAFKLPKSYTANASLLMSLSKDYVYQPLAGDAANGATSTIDQVVQSETEILNSTELKKRVIAKLGYKAVLPDAPELWNPQSAADRAKSDYAALQVLQSGLSTQTAPQDNVVRLSFKASTATSASLILNTLIDEYQARRLEVYSNTLGPLLHQQRSAFDDQLATDNQAYADFLKQNGVGDFDASKTTWSKVYDLAQTDLSTTNAQISQDEAKLATVTANLSQLNPEMSTERDLDLSVPTKILTLQAQRQDLLSRYLPDAQPVKDVDAQIASLQALVNSGAGIGEKDHKLGTNTVYQDMLTQKLNLQSDLEAQKARRQQDQAQADDATNKLQNLTSLQAQYDSLSTDRSATQDSLKSFAQREQQNEAANAMAKGADGSVRVVEKADPPARPKSLKSIVLILALLFAGVSALCAGLMRVYTRKGFANAGMASRALDLPVLAEAGVKAA